MHRTLLIVTALFLVVPTHGFAQYPFGKNKVSYTKMEWKVLETENVDIYYYPSEGQLVEFIAPVVEETYQEFSALFRVDFRERVPVIFYGTHYDFQQTNIVPSLISEYTAGFTDLVKGRIAIPFTGSLADMRHVVRHEMVHAFMLEKLAQVMQNAKRYTYSHPPLWFVEGMAEYIANPAGDSRGHMFVRDALVHGDLLDLVEIWRIEGSFMMYKEGESVVRYIAANYGDEAIIEILENWWKADKFTLVLQETINMSLEELSDAYLKWARRRYYPTLLTAEFAPDIGDQLTRKHSFHSRPTASLGSDGQARVYALGARDGVVNLLQLVQDGGGTLHGMSLIESNRNGKFESIPAFRSKIEASGDELMFVAKRGARDAIYIIDTNKRRIRQHYSFEGIHMISSPTRSGDGSQIVFSAVDTSGTMDLYLYDVPSKHLTRLTNDPYTEEDPDFHPTRNIVLFASDRCDTIDRRNRGIYSIDVNTQKIWALTCGPFMSRQPEWSPSGDSFLFSSDRHGIDNIYLYDYVGQTITRQTNVIGGLSTPAFMPDGRSFIASGYYRGEFHLYKFPLDSDAGGVAPMVAYVDSSSTDWIDQRRKYNSYNSKKYSQKLGLDFAGVGVAVDPDFGSVGNAASMALSDVLGNHQYGFFIGNTSEGTDQFLRRLNVGVSYTNYSNRINYSLSVFNLNTVNNDGFNTLRREKRVGVSTGLSFPLSRFTRIDGALVLRYVERESDYVGLNQPTTFLASTFITYVTDNTLWTIGGPLKGWRYYLTVGRTHDFRNRGFENTTMQLDFRKYFKLTNRIVFATRMQTRQSWGGDFQLFYLGGPWDLRGYEFREFFGRGTYLLNTEFRFPLLDRLMFALPFGGVELPLFRGSLFFDMGRSTRYISETDWLGSFGAGVELNLGYAPVIRVNFTRLTDFATIGTNTGVQFFIGYNY